MPDCAGCAKMCNSLRNPAYLYSSALATGPGTRGYTPWTPPIALRSLVGTVGKEFQQSTAKHARQSKSRLAKQLRLSLQLPVAIARFYCSSPPRQ